MFVNNIRENEILEFLKTYDEYKDAINVQIVIPAELQVSDILLFSVVFSKKPKTSTSRLITATNTEIFFRKNEKWIKYLYSIFGESYKNWYKKQQEEEFKRLFKSN